MGENFITNIEIEKYKCFNNFKASNFKRINLIGGKNNVGKTAFMEACYLGKSQNGNEEKQREFFHALLVLELVRNPLKEFSIVEDSNNFNFKYEDAIIKLNDNLRSDRFMFSESLYRIPEKDYNTGIKEITQFYSGKNKMLNIKNKNFITMNSIRPKFIAECIDEIKLNNREDELCDILQTLFGIKKIDVIKHQVMIKEQDKFRPLFEYGDGIKYFINILLSLFLNKNNIIFFDEIENGMHYSLFDKMWEIILILSKERNIQIFATTHSKECIESYARVAKKLEDEEIAMVILSKNLKGELKSLVYNKKELLFELGQNHEVRGW